MSKRSANWPRAWGGAVSPGCFNTLPEHFQVTELPLTEPSGEGEHLWLWIEKEQINTHDVVMTLSRELGIKPVLIGYAGRKDRQAICQQWLSVQINEQQAEALQTAYTGFKVLKTRRNNTKLSTGELCGNHFRIRLTELSGSKTDYELALKEILLHGFPNYFGPQRFGRKYQNLIRGERMLSGQLRVRERNQRSMYLSACRSFLFNELLAERIRRDNWRSVLEGDVTASHSEQHDVPQGWLVGDGDLPVSGMSESILKNVLTEHETLYKGIRNSRVQWQSRALVTKPEKLIHQWDGQDLVLEFELPSGAFATSLLRELITIDD